MVESSLGIEKYWVGKRYEIEVKIVGYRKIGVDLSSRKIWVETIE